MRVAALPRPNPNKTKNMATTTTSEDVEIKINNMANKPTSLYQQLSVQRDWKDNFKELQPMKLDSPKPKNSLRFVFISDTHNQTDNLKLPEGDILLHAGDFSQTGLPSEVQHFIRYLESVQNQFQHVIVIAGNHELPFDVENYGKGVSAFYHKNKKIDGKALKESIKSKFTYLEDELVEISGIKIYGSPWQPVFGDWAFNLKRGEECLEKWKMIPNGVDVLVTHGPPLGHGDRCQDGARAGCMELLSTIQLRVKPKYHVFGHIHEGYGITTDGLTTYINASSVNLRYKQVHQPIIFDIPIPNSV